MLLKKKILYVIITYYSGSVVWRFRRIKLKDVKVGKDLSHISIGTFNNKKFTIDTLDTFCRIWNINPEKKGNYIYVVEENNN